MQFNVSYDSSVSSLDAGIRAQLKAAVKAAVDFFKHVIADPVAVNIKIAFAPLASGTAGSNSFFLQGFNTYGAVKAALVAHASSADDLAANTSLPARNPGNSVNGYMLTGPQARALGFSANFALDATITLNSNLGWNWDPNNRGPGNGNFDAIGVLEHEISEGVFGRFQNLNVDGNHSNTVLDLFRFTAAENGTRTLGANSDGWFSLDGIHNLERYNNHSVAGGDLGDWYPPIQGDSFGDAYAGEASLVTPTDLRVLDILGWTRTPATGGDLNGDGVSDILLANNATGQLKSVTMNGAREGIRNLGTLSTRYTVLGTGDFNRDFAVDVLYRNDATGGLGWWASSSGGGGTGSGDAPGNDAAGKLGAKHALASLSLAYDVRGIGDLDGNGTPDILYRDHSTGRLGFVQMNDGAIVGKRTIGALSTAYVVAMGGDFNGDGTSDILCKNTSTGALSIIEMRNGDVLDRRSLGIRQPAGTSVFGIGDFNGDGTSDILYEDVNTGTLGIIEMQDGVALDRQRLGMLSTANSIVGTGDYDGNGTTDILYREATGRLDFLEIDNSHIVGRHGIGVFDSSLVPIAFVQGNGGATAASNPGSASLAHALTEVAGAQSLYGPDLFGMVAGQPPAGGGANSDVGLARLVQAAAGFVGPESPFESLAIPSSAAETPFPFVTSAPQDWRS